MKKLLLIIALTLTANAESLCNSYRMSVSSSVDKGAVEMQYGKGYMAKLYFKDALHAIIDSKRFCPKEDHKLLDEVKDSIVKAIKKIDDVDGNTNTSTDIGNEVW